MAAVFKICILLTIVLFFNQNVCSKKTNFLRSLHKRVQKGNSKNGSKKNAAVVPATHQKPQESDSQAETNKRILAALYGGLGMGVESAGSFDYANSLNAKIQGYGGYGIPSGIYSYAFDPTTGMPFMCDPSKTPPGGQSQVTSAAGIKPAAQPPPAATNAQAPAPATAPAPVTAPAPAPGKPFQADKPSVQSADSHVSTPAAVSPAKTPPAQNAPASNTGEQKLSPVNDVSTSMSFGSSSKNTGKGAESNDKPNPTPVNAKIFPGKETNSNNLDKDIMLPMSPSKPTGSDVSNDVNKDIPEPTPFGNQKMGTTNSNYGSQLTSSKLSPGNPKNTATQSKLAVNKLTPLVTDTRTRSLSKLINGQKFKTSRRNTVSIKLPEIPPCPDMRQYHWPWNCLENGKGNVKKECIERARESLPYAGYFNELQSFYYRR